jgi:hypothetical protein
MVHGSSNLMKLNFANGVGMLEDVYLFPSFPFFISIQYTNKSVVDCIVFPRPIHGRRNDKEKNSARILRYKELSVSIY